MIPPLLAADAAGELVVAALRAHGAAFVADPEFAAPHGRDLLAGVAAFFARSDAAKNALAIERSPHFRGYSRMHNERDFREQLHFGSERTAAVQTDAHWRLQGPNLWPADDAAFRARMLAATGAAQRLGERWLAAIASAFGLDARTWLGADPYVLTKAIGYHAQAGGVARRGVAAHLDFSLLTLTLQDDVGGLELRAPDGAWRHVATPPGAWLVHPGELLQFVLGNRLVATPHRVVNPSAARLRCSLPVFVNPSLDTVLHRLLPLLEAPPEGADHVHVVLDPGDPTPMLPFGPAEWRRKGENGWCRRCAPARSPATPGAAPG
jgi:isopenicillin N synthase-like dioxygenase